MGLICSANESDSAGLTRPEHRSYLTFYWRMVLLMLVLGMMMIISCRNMVMLVTPNGQWQCLQKRITVLAVANAPWT